MDISNYIQELLFTKQKVVIPEIGTFEMVGKPAHIDSATGTITPPSKTIKFSYNEGADYSVLVNHIAKRKHISIANAVKLVYSFSEQLNNRLRNGEEVEIESVGILRVIGAGTIIFLPFSSYSNLGESFGLPTITLSPNAKRQQVVDEANTEQPDLKGQQPIDDTVILAESLGAIETTNEEESFELIDDFIEETSPEIVEPHADTSTAEEEKSNAPIIEEKPLTPELGNNEVTPSKEEKLAVSEGMPNVIIPIVEEPAISTTPIVEIPVELSESTVEKHEPINSFFSTERNLDDIPLPNIKIETEGVSDEEIVVRKNKNSWVWLFLIIICILAIGFVALYHYNSNIFAFMLPSEKSMIAEPSEPSDADTSYYKTLTGAANDTSSINDSTRADSARANLQKIDSTAKKALSTKKASSTTPDLKKRPMTKEEMETLINEKLKLGATTTIKTSDTQQKATTTKPIQIQETKKTKPAAAVSTTTTIGSYYVIAASVKSAAEAKKVSESLKTKGYNPQILDNGKGQIRISIGAYPNSRQAVNAAHAAKKKLGNDAWILTP